MIVDSSALIAIVKDEPEAGMFASVLRRPSGKALIAAPTMVEAGVVADGLGPVWGRRFDAVVRDLRLETVAFDAQLAHVARQAYRDFGRGSGHPAKLNFGDCFSYALATLTGEPLLYKGDDFGHTDVRSALEDLRSEI